MGDNAVAEQSDNEKEPNQMTVNPDTISADTISICLELLDNISVPPATPDAVDKMRRLVSARDELMAALTDQPEINGHQPTPAGVSVTPT